MSEQNHPWCSDVARDEAIRLAEDDAANWRRLDVGEVIVQDDQYLIGSVWRFVPSLSVGGKVQQQLYPVRRRRVPLPDHRELPAAVAELRERVGRLEQYTEHGNLVSTVRLCLGCGCAVLGGPTRCARCADASTENREAVPGSREGVTFTENGVFREAKTPSGAVNPAADASGGDVDGLRDIRDSRPANGLRTERVTLEITQQQNNYVPAREWSWREYLSYATHFLPGESVRVVDDDLPAVHDTDGDRVVMSWPELAKRLTAERDAALRERDAAREECERLRGRLATLEPIAKAHESAIKAAEKFNAEQARKAMTDPSSVYEFADAMANGMHAGTAACLRPIMHAIIDQRDAYKARVAELEQQIKLDDRWSAAAANAGGQQPQPPRGWLTKNERAAVESARDYFAAPEHDDDECAFLASALRSLLARSTPPKVRRPHDWPESMVRDLQWIAAIREAGGEVVNE